MAWRSPITTLSASRVTPGTFNGTYSLTGGRIQTSGFGCYLDGNTGRIGISSGTDADFDIRTAVLIPAGRWSSLLEGAAPAAQLGGPGQPVITMASRNGDGTGASGITLGADVVSGPNGTVFDGARGVVTATPDASGYVTVTHGLGRVPVGLKANAMSPDGGSPILGYVITPLGRANATTFQGRCVSTAGAAITTVACTFSWEAW